MASLPRAGDDPGTALILRFQKGDEQAFQELVERFKVPVFNFVWHQIGDPSEAEDIAQNVFVQVYKSAARYEPRAKFTTWLFTIARNLCLNEFRRRHRHPVDSIHALQKHSDDPHSEEPFQHPDPTSRAPYAEVMERELQEQIFEAIQQLPENQRSAVILCRYEGLSYEEIAEVLKLSESAIKSLMHRARETLKEKLHHLIRET
jgi:RNA polymerase sigma-70 factor, ECF subfamily